MIKIKDNVDLNILQKYDFVDCGVIFFKMIDNTKNSKTEEYAIEVDKRTRVINVMIELNENTFGCFSESDTLFDLIQDDLVEKYKIIHKNA